MKKRFLIYALIAIVTLIILSLAPRGRISSNSNESIGAILPSGIYEQGEDGSSYGYLDKCGKDIDCRSCKSNLTCLECMNKCYNRYGAFYKKDNPRLAGAMLCNSKCVDVAEKKKVDADLRFADPDNKKIK